MSILIKHTIILLIIFVTIFASQGCNSSSFHNLDDTVWIEQQVQQGKLTREEADKLLADIKKETTKNEK